MIDSGTRQFRSILRLNHGQKLFLTATLPLVLVAGMRIQMDDKGRWNDNRMIEHPRRSLM